MSTLTVHVPEVSKNYPLKIKRNCLATIGQEIKTVYSNKKIAVITDQNVQHHYGESLESNLEKAGFEVKTIILPPGEQTKSLDVLAQLYTDLIAFNLTRSDLIIAFGGGVIGDLAGYLAATYLRGIPYVQIPTTLLAQVDSSVGGKVAVDLPQGKNLVGAFYHPKLVLIDPNVLETLSDSSFSDGMAEVIKYGCIKDRNFFKQLKTYHSRVEIMKDIEEIIYTCCRIKSDVVKADEKDLSERMILNFGHTIGHAIEAYYHYDKYTHGQGVAIGMVAMNQLTENLGITAKGTTAEIRQLLLENHLPTELEDTADYQNILPLIEKDKKNINNTLYIVVLKELGGAMRYEVDQTFFTPLIKGE